MGELDSLSELTKEVRQLVCDMLGPAAKEVGAAFGEQLKYWRFKRAIRILEKTSAILREKNIQPTAVNLKLLVPLLEGASLEEDDDLVARWAALLASAAAADFVHPSFPKILSELTPIEARILDQIYDGHSGEKFLVTKLLPDLEALSEEQINVAFNNLFRQQLCEPETFVTGPKWDQAYSEVKQSGLRLTPFGKDFVRACRGPSAIKKQ
jgi:hypothetical protein